MNPVIDLHTITKSKSGSIKRYCIQWRWGRFLHKNCLLLLWVNRLLQSIINYTNKVLLCFLGKRRGRPRRHSELDNKTIGHWVWMRGAFNRECIYTIIKVNVGWVWLFNYLILMTHFAHQLSITWLITVLVFISLSREWSVLFLQRESFIAHLTQILLNWTQRTSRNKTGSLLAEKWFMTITSCPRVIVKMSKINLMDLTLFFQGYSALELFPSTLTLNYHWSRDIWYKSLKNYCDCCDDDDRKTIISIL